MTLKITQVVPGLPPTISGVGDYAFLLARQLRAKHDIETTFLVCDSAWPGEDNLKGFTAKRISKPKSAELQKHLCTSEIPTVLVHYVGYGYQKRGVPFWLVREIESWRRGAHERRLIVMFHELHAFGPPWRSSFWVSPLQKGLVRALASVADHCVTNLASYVEALRSMTNVPRTKMSRLPVFSNVGETTEAPDLKRRMPRMVVFGSAGWRWHAYHRHSNAIEAACKQLNIAEIIDIGPSFQQFPKLSVRCTPLGNLSACEVNRELTQARAGFFAYPARCLGKSSIFAAYAAHGLIPVTYERNIARDTDGVRAYEHFLPVPCAAAVPDKMGASIANRAHCWYLAHRLSRQASKYSALIRTCVASVQA